MQTRSRLLHDLTRVAGGAMSTAVGMKDEVEALLRHRLDRLVQGLDLAASEDLEAVRAVAVRAREEQERLSERVAELERQLRAVMAGSPAAGRSAGPSHHPRSGTPAKARKARRSAKAKPKEGAGRGA